MSEPPDEAGRPPEAPQGAGSWELMETRLVAAQVGDLLERAAGRLAGLAKLDGMAAETLAEVAEVLAALDLTRAQVARIRRRPQGDAAPVVSESDGGTDHLRMVPSIAAGSR